MRNNLLIPAIILALCAIVAGVFWWSYHPPTADSPRPSPVAQTAPDAPDTSLPSQTTQPPSSSFFTPGTSGITAQPTPPRDGTTAVAPVPGANALPPSAPLAIASVQDKQRGMVELEKAQHMVHDYHTLMGENPVGTNAEIMGTLMGGNSRQAQLGPPEGQQLNDKGELVDAWGTPYFFHQLSKDRMEVHSAGPDKIMGTADDLVLK